MCVCRWCVQKITRHFFFSIAETIDQRHRCSSPPLLLLYIASTDVVHVRSGDKRLRSFNVRIIFLSRERKRERERGRERERRKSVESIPWKPGFYLETPLTPARFKRSNRSSFVPKVYTRNARGIRGHVEAYVAAFDKHWNLALEDCFEIWTRKVKRKAPALGKLFWSLRFFFGFNWKNDGFDEFDILYIFERVILMDVWMVVYYEIRNFLLLLLSWGYKFVAFVSNAFSFWLFNTNLFENLNNCDTKRWKYWLSLKLKAINNYI